MAHVKLVLVAATLIFNIFVLGDPSKCYDCLECEEPFNPDTARIAECINYTLPVYELFQKQFNDPLDADTVCMKVVLADSKGNITDRGCFPKKFLEIDDPCEFIETNIENTTCTICDTDLCNV